MKQCRKKRYARRLDGPRTFNPKEQTNNTKIIEITLDEFEALRLSDYEGLSQIDAAEEMQVSRATIQRLLVSARSKLVEAILNNNEFRVLNETANIKLKGENNMRIEEKTLKRISFPTSDRTTIDGHFGHTKEFAIYEVEGLQIKSINFVTPPPHEPGVLPRFLGSIGVDVIITGGMGQMAINLFKQQNIDVVLGASGNIDSNLKEYVSGFLSSTGSPCSHHHGDHDHDGHGSKH